MHVAAHASPPAFPAAAPCAGVRSEQGQDAVEEACEAIVLLHEQSNQSARFWACPSCDQKFNSGREFLAHVELAHEELAVQVHAWALERPWELGFGFLFMTC